MNCEGKQKQKQTIQFPKSRNVTGNKMQKIIQNYASYKR